MNIARTACFGVLCCLAAQTLSAQGILIVERDNDGSTDRIQIDNNHIRVDAHSDGKAQVFMFDGVKQIARFVKLDEKSYTEITKSDMEKMRAQVDSAMAQLEAQLKNMPPQQRQAIEQMMKGRGGFLAAALPKIEYRKTGSDKVAQYACTTYDGYEGQEKVRSVCTVDPSQFGVTAADFEVSRQLSEFIKTVLPQAANQVFSFGKAEDEGFSGVPIRQIDYDNGKVVKQSELAEFRRETFPASLFDAPAGFHKESMPPFPQLGR